MIVVGLTGGIASGKTFIVKYLKKQKIPTHESDLVIKKMYLNPKKNFISFLLKSGFNIAINKKKIDKKIIRNIIINNSRKRKIIEKYLHKKVQEDRVVFLKKNKVKKIVFLDIPLLFEKKLEFLCDYICSAIATNKIREKRAVKRKGMNANIFKKIVKIQTTNKLRKLKSNYIVDTSKTKKKTYLQVDNIIYDILKKRK